MKLSLFNAFSNRFSHDFLSRHNIVSLISHRDRYSVLLVLLFASLALGIFGVNALLQGKSQLGVILLIISAVCGGFVLYEKYIDHIKFIKSYSTIFLVFLFFYLIINGGLNNTGLLWCYPLSIILFILYESKVGIYINIVLLIFVSLIFSSLGQEFLIATYSYAEKTRFIFSYFFLVLFIYIIAYAEELLVVKLDESREALLKAALSDEMTGLGNRLYIKDALSKIDRRDIKDTKLTAVMMIDIDRFKHVNDNFGHNAGDQVIKEVANRLKKLLRKTDLVARWGGEEFLVVLTNTEFEAAIKIAENLRLKIASKSIFYKKHHINITVSIGLTKFKGAVSDFSKIVEIADKNLYHAKKTGRNKVIS